MISYSDREIFSIHDLAVLRQAEQFVAVIPETLADVRCHELARAVGQMLDLPHQDGFYGFVDHTWVWTRPLGRTMGRVGFPNVLDVYCVGSSPQVRLLDGEHTQLPHIGWASAMTSTRTV